MVQPWMLAGWQLVGYQTWRKEGITVEWFNGKKLFVITSVSGLSVEIPIAVFGEILEDLEMSIVFHKEIDRVQNVVEGMRDGVYQNAQHIEALKNRAKERSRQIAALKDFSVVGIMDQTLAQAADIVTKDTDT